MNLFCNNALISLFILTSLCTATNLNKEQFKSDSEEEDGDIDWIECIYECCNDNYICKLENSWQEKFGHLSDVEIAAIVILFGISILLSCCCACCCCRSRPKSRVTDGAVAAPTTQYVQVQQTEQYNNLGGQTRTIFTQSLPTYNVNNQHNESLLTNDCVHLSQMYEQPPPYYEVASLYAESQPSAPRISML